MPRDFDVDYKYLDDFVEFARIEQESGDIEPWAALYRDLHLNSGLMDLERTHWLLTLHNTYDHLSSAWKVLMRWESPWVWEADPRRDEAADQLVYPIMSERRNLYGGKVLRRHHSYIGQMGDRSQDEWLRDSLLGISPEVDFQLLMERTRDVWGVGRQSAFEWAEFVAKVLDFPIHAPTAELWESSGPRESLELLYGKAPNNEWLDAVADHARGYLASAGVHLEWEDFETVVCDFKVMRKGRYYPGRHLANLKEDIGTVPQEYQPVFWDAWNRIVPEDWREIPPGINKEYMPVYAKTGLIRSHA
jgi:hypothetical protein